VRSAAFSPDGRRIVTASGDKTARLWDAETGKPVGEELAGHDHYVYSAVFNPGGDRILTASWDKTARLWDAEGKPIKELNEHSAAVRSAAFSPDGRRIVTASDDKTARLWDAETGQPIGEPLTGHEGDMYSAAFSPDGRRIITASWDRTVRLWDAESGKAIGEPFRGHQETVYSAAFSPDGRRIITASWDRTVRQWSTETGKPIGEPLNGHSIGVYSVAFSPDGQRIVTASGDHTARLWDAEGKPIGEPLRHGDHVWSVVFSPTLPAAQKPKRGLLTQLFGLDKDEEPVDGLIVTASLDKTARLWDLKGRPIGELKGHKGAVYSAAFSPDGQRIVTASGDHTARLWAIFPRSQKLIDLTKTVVPRCLTGAQRENLYLSPLPPSWCIEMKKWPYHTQTWKDWLAARRTGKDLAPPKE
jgi:WD40 repeat protein